MGPQDSRVEAGALHSWRALLWGRAFGSCFPRAAASCTEQAPLLGSSERVHMHNEAHLGPRWCCGTLEGSCPFSGPEFPDLDHKGADFCLTVQELVVPHLSCLHGTLGEGAMMSPPHLIQCTGFPQLSWGLLQRRRGDWRGDTRWATRVWGPWLLTRL